MNDQRAFQDRTARAASQVLDRLAGRWADLEPSTRQAVEPSLRELEAALRSHTDPMRRGNAVYAFLRAMEGLPGDRRLGSDFRDLASSGITRSIPSVGDQESQWLLEQIAGILEAAGGAPAFKPPPGGEILAKTPLSFPSEAPQPGKPGPGMAEATGPIRWYQEPASTLERVWQRLKPETGGLSDEVSRSIYDLLVELDKDLRYAESDDKRGQYIAEFLNAIEVMPEAASLVQDILDAARLQGEDTVRKSPSATRQEVEMVIKDILPPPQAANGGNDIKPPSFVIIQPPPTEPMDPTPKDVSPITVDYHTFADFPGQVSLRDRHIPLTVQLTLEQRADSVAEGTARIGFDYPQQTHYVTVLCHAEGFREDTGNVTRTIEVYANRDSQPAVFLLTPDPTTKTGAKRIKLDFYHANSLAGSAEFITQLLAEKAAQAPTPARLSQPAVFDRPLAAAIDPVDLELRITTGADKTELFYMLHSHRRDVGYHWHKAGSVKLNKEPRLYLDFLYNRLNRMAASDRQRRDEEQTEDYREELRSLGRDLYDRLFSDELKRQYRERIQGLCQDGTVKNLLITSDEPWIPWELVRPFEFDQDGNTLVDDDFLCAQFRLSRWLVVGRGVPARLDVRTAQMVIPPDTNLIYTEQERDYFRDLHDRRPPLTALPAIGSIQDVIDAFQEASAQLYHFSCHGNFEVASADESPLQLQDGMELTPRDLQGEPARGVARSKPLVFLNACHGGQIGNTIRGLGGWAEFFVRFGASAFVGALWEVNDKLAAQFAIAFYERLWEGDSLGDALHAARATIRQADPGNPTWLAYTLYADPNGKWSRS